MSNVGATKAAFTVRLFKEEPERLPQLFDTLPVALFRIGSTGSSFVLVLTEVGVSLEF